MTQLPIQMSAKKHIALVAHDNMKDDLLAWAKFNLKILQKHHLFATGTTGWLLEHELDLPITKLQSARSVAISKLEPKFLKGRSTVLSSFGTRCRHNRTTLMCGRCSALQRYGTFLPPQTAPRPIFLSPPP